jgi:DNA-binding LacI/PurR family transcriptional regulator
MKSKYRVILDEIMIKIENGTYRPGDMIPTESDFATLYDASRTTVQRALNILVSKGVIYRVAGRGTFVADEPLTTNVMRGNGEKTFSLILPNHSRESILYARGAQVYLERKNYRLNTHFPENHHKNIITEVETLLEFGCPGIIIYPATSDDDTGFFRRLALQNIPIVTIDKEITGSLLSCVVSNNYIGTYSLTEYLISRGHADFVYFSQNPSAANTLADRLCGFKDCLNDKGINIDNKKIIIDLPLSDNDVINTIKKYLIEHPRSEPFVAFCGHDRIALNVYHAAYDLNLKIPENLSVVGFDDIDLAAALYPSLTTVAQPFFEIGVNAARTILRSYEKQDNTIYQIRLSTSPIYRNSVIDLREVN